MNTIFIVSLTNAYSFNGMYFEPKATIISQSSTKMALLSLGTSFHIVWTDKSLKSIFTYPLHILVKTNGKILRNVTKTGADFTIVPIFYGLNDFGKFEYLLEKKLFPDMFPCSKKMHGWKLFGMFDKFMYTQGNIIFNETFSNCKIS